MARLLFVFRLCTIPEYLSWSIFVRLFIAFSPRPSRLFSPQLPVCCGLFSGTLCLGLQCWVWVTLGFSIASARALVLLLCYRLVGQLVFPDWCSPLALRLFRCSAFSPRPNFGFILFVRSWLRSCRLPFASGLMVRCPLCRWLLVPSFWSAPFPRGSSAVFYFPLCFRWSLSCLVLFSLRAQASRVGRPTVGPLDWFLLLGPAVSLFPCRGFFFLFAFLLSISACSRFVVASMWSFPLHPAAA